MARRRALEGPRHEIDAASAEFPPPLASLAQPPKRLYVIGSIEALEEGLAVIGSRRATPYGISCARHFAGMAARRGIVIVSGGARGCDAAAHRAAVDGGSRTVVFLGGGCDWVYPAENAPLFQAAIDGGGAVASEFDWATEPKPWMFRQRNRLIAGLAKATLIVEAGIPSGTFSTAEEAIDADREVWAVPGSLSSAQSRGANLLISEGAHPIVGDESFAMHLSRVFGAGDGRADADVGRRRGALSGVDAALVGAMRAEPLTVDEIMRVAKSHVRTDDLLRWTMVWLATEAPEHGIVKYPNGRYGPVVEEA